jgi:hypothetical protein
MTNNPAVDKILEQLKQFGIRHGEKVGMAIAAASFLAFVGMSFSRESIQMTPDEVKAHAKQAADNIRRPQTEASIIQKIENDKIVVVNFDQKVKESSSKELVASEYALPIPWTTNEPGAGLVREDPVLLAATELYASRGRGGVLMYQLDENGDPIPLTEKDKQKPRPTKRRKKRPAAGMGGMSGMMGGMGGGGGRKKRVGPSSKKQEAQAEAERKNQQRKQELAGSVDEAAEAAKEKEEKEDNQEYKQTVKGLRWVVVTGVLDNKAFIKNFSKALKQTSAHPNYLRLDVTRQVRDSNGDWSDWEKVDLDRNYMILDNLPDSSEELTPDTVRIETLIDPLPKLRTGNWQGVHIARLVPKDKRQLKPPPGAGGGAGGGYVSSGSDMMAAMMGQQDQSSMMNQMMSQNSQASSMMQQMMGNQQSGYGNSMKMSGMGMGMGGAAEADYPKSDADEIMIRSLDFTVDPDTTYRYRVRVVVKNPNYKYDNVMPGTNTKDKELFGPWSEPSNEVDVPPDVMVHLEEKTPEGTANPGGDQVTYQVARWNPEDGLNICRPFRIMEGESIGSPVSMSVPKITVEEDSATQPQNKSIDFNSHEILLDDIGGSISLAALEPDLPPMELPAASVMLRSDGRLTIHEEVADHSDPMKKALRDDWERASKPPKKKKSGSSMMGGAMMMQGR